MTVPRDLSGTQLAKVLARYGYKSTRQTGSHMRLTSAIQGYQHHITIPNHKYVKLGTLHGILRDVAAYLKKEPAALQKELFD